MSPRNDMFGSKLLRVTRRGRTFVEDLHRDDDASDLDDFSVRLLTTYCEPSEEMVEFDGGNCRATVVHITRSDANVGYVVAGIQPEETTHQLESDAWGEYARLLRKRVARYESLFPASRQDFDSTFVEPALSAGSSRDELSWKVLAEAPYAGLHYVITGAPGVGKTSLLRRIALEHVDRTARDPSNSVLPVYLQLRGLREPELTGDLIRRAMVNEAGEDLVGALAPRLHTASIILLLDGLDEVEPHLRPTLLASLAQLMSREPRLFVILSSRPSIKLESIHSTFTHVALRPFDRDRVHRWTWLSSDNVQTWTKLTGRLERNPVLRELARNPLALSMIAAAEAESGSALDYPGGIVDEYVRVLVEDWDRARGVKRESLDRSRAMWLLAHTANQALVERRTDFGPDDYARWRADVTHRLAPNDELDQLAELTGCLRRDTTSGAWSFASRVLLAYFVAEYVRRSGPEFTKRLPAVLDAPGGGEAWVMLTSGATNLEPFIDALADDEARLEAPILAMVVRALGQAVEQQNQYATVWACRVREALERGLNSDVPLGVERSRDGVSMGTIAHLRGSEVGVLLEAVHSVWDTLFGAAVRQELTRAPSAVVKALVDVLDIPGPATVGRTPSEPLLRVADPPRPFDERVVAQEYARRSGFSDGSQSS